MSEEQGEGNQGSVSEESAVCVGDGTTCVECGKLFTHPFYFSTHISTHTNQKGFVVVGQCALCGLVFSNAAVLAAHLISSQTRLEKQVTPQDDSETAMSYSESNSKLTSQSNPNLEKKCLANQKDTKDQQVVKTNSPSAQTGEVSTSGIGEPATSGIGEPAASGIGEPATSSKESTELGINAEPRLKRKRKAPQWFEPDTVPPPAPAPVLTDADAEVEAYLLSLKQMGLTVDPAAFSSHRGGKRRRKVSEGGKGRVKKELPWAGETVDLASDVLSPKKASPKYEYLDSDDSFEEEPEVLPESGKLTRGQRLQQRLERLSQIKEEDTVSGTKKPGPAKLNVTGSIVKEESERNNSAASDSLVNKLSKADVPRTELVVNAAATKCGQPVAGPSRVIKKESTIGVPRAHINNVYRPPLASTAAGKNTGYRMPQPNVSKFNTIRTPPVSSFVGRNNQYRMSPLSNTGSRMYQTNAAVNASNVGQRAVGIQQGKARERKNNPASYSGSMNVQKSNSLEDLKKNSRENVEQMLQSIGMIAVTSTAMGQGKMFSSQNAKSGETSFPPAFGFQQPSFPRGFPSRPFNTPKTTPRQAFSYRGQTRFWPKPVGGRGQDSSSAAWANNHKSPRGRQSASPQTFMSGPSTSYQRGSGHGRGVGTGGERGQHQYNNVRGSIRGSGLNVAVRSRARSVTNPVQSRGISRGRASFIQKQTKPVPGSKEVIVIEDDDVQDIPSDSAGIEDPLPVKSHEGGDIHLRSKSVEAQKSSPARSTKGSVTILDVDLDSGVSDIKIIEDKTQVLSPVATCMETEDDTGVEKHSNKDDESLDAEDASKAELGSAKSVKSRQKRKCTESFADETECSQADNENEPCTSKSVTEKDNCCDKIKEDTDIMPGEDIDGWKVCLAENSDSNEDYPSPPSTPKTSSSRDHHVSPVGSPEQSSSKSPHKTVLEGPEQDDSSYQCSSNPSEIVNQGSSESPGDVLNQYVSATIDSAVPIQSTSELQENTRTDTLSDAVGSEGQDTDVKDEKGTGNQTVPVSHCPSQFSEHETGDTKSETSGSSNSGGDKNTADCDISSESRDESLSLSTIQTEVDSAENCADNAGKCNQSDQAVTSCITTDLTKCVEDKATEEQEELFKSNINDGSSSSLLPPDDDVTSDRKNFGSIGVSKNVLDDLAKDETTVKESSEKTNECETSSTSTVASTDNHVDNIDSSLSSNLVCSEASFSKEDTDSVLPDSENELCLEKNKTDSNVGNGESHADANTKNSSNSVGSSDVLTSQNNAEPVYEPLSSHSPNSQASTEVSADFLRDGNSLLDIFTEIEKTCKEMVKTLDNETGSQAVMHNEDVKVLPDVLGNSQEVDKKEGSVVGVVDIAEGSNEISVKENGSDDGLQESSSGDCWNSGVTCENEVVEGGSEVNENEVGEEIKEIEKEGITKEDYRKQGDLEVKDTGRDHAVSGCNQEMRHTPEED